MKTKRFYWLLCFLITTTTYAQLPPVFGHEYDSIAQKDELTRAFISPVRVMWTSDKTAN